MSARTREDINRIKNVSFWALLSKSAHLKNVRTGERWVSISPFIFCFIAHPTVRSISCWVLWLDQVFRKLNFIQNSWLEFAADDDWWDNDNFGRGQSGVGAKNKRLVRARQVSSNWDVSQVCAFSFIALISVSTVQLLLLLVWKLNSLYSSVFPCRLEHYVTVWCALIFSK